MKPLQHVQISRKKYGGKWQDYIEVHNFWDSRKMFCDHFKHRFFLLYQFLAKKRNQIENDAVKNEIELFDAFNLSEKDRVSVKDFLLFPLKTPHIQPRFFFRTILLPFSWLKKP